MMVNYFFAKIHILFETSKKILSILSAIFQPKFYLYRARYNRSNNMDTPCFVRRRSELGRRKHGVDMEQNRRRSNLDS